MSNVYCSLHDKTNDRLVPLQAVAVKGVVDGFSVSWQVIQRFTNNEKKAIEAVFSFPLPAGATLSSLKIITGDRIITAVTDEREKAFERYDEAISEGNGAFLLDQERPDLFVMSLGNLLPGQQVEIQLSMFQLLEAQADSARVSFPVVIVPRYFPAASAAEISEWERISPDYAARVPYGFSFNLKIIQNSALRTVESPSHPIRVEFGRNEADINLSQASVMPDKDIVVNFSLVEKIQPGITRCVFKGREHFLVELFPEIEAEESTAPKEVVFVVDCSGSMQGDSIREAVNALQLCVRSLNEGDYFQIVCFGSNHQRLFKKPQVLNDQTLEEATRLISCIGADMGGTEILPAMQAAVQGLQTEFASLMLFTDGEVGNEKEVIDFAVSSRGKCRVFSFGIGNGASESLVRGVADRSGGAAEFVFPGERIEPKVLRQFKRLSAPILSEIEAAWECSGLEAVPAVFNRLFSGEVIRLAARAEPGKALPDKLKVTLSAMCGAKKLAFTAESPRLSVGSVPALWWAQKRIEILENGENKIGSGSNQGRKKTKNADSEMIELSKEYGIICAKTSLVGVEERVGSEKNDGRVELRRVPVMVPAARDFMGSVAGSGIISRCCTYLADSFAASISPAPAILRSLNEDSGRGFSLMSRRPPPSGAGNDGGAKSAIELPSVPSAPAGKEDRIIEILVFAGSDGLFKHSKRLLGLIDASEADFAAQLAIAPAGLASADREKFAMSMLVKAYLENNCQPEKDLWSAIIEKGRRKLQSWSNGSFSE